MPGRPQRAELFGTDATAARTEEQQEWLSGRSHRRFGSLVADAMPWSKSGRRQPCRRIAGQVDDAGLALNSHSCGGVGSSPKEAAIPSPGLGKKRKLRIADFGKLPSSAHSAS